MSDDTLRHVIRWNVGHYPPPRSQRSTVPSPLLSVLMSLREYVCVQSIAMHAGYGVSLHEQKQLTIASCLRWLPRASVQTNI
jgi:hypothetical protein